MSKLSEETEKRYLPTEYLNTLKEQTSQRASTDFARLLFLFSYYTYGMSFIDMALLKHSNIEKLEQGKYIVYKRQKVINNSDTKSIKIKINPKTEEIISLLCNHQQPLSDYLLPLVTRQKDEPEALYNHIFNRRKRYGKNLKELAKEFKFDVNLTSYVSRHTMAMQLQKNDVPEAVISQVLNHSDLKTTKVYLDKLDVAKIDQAAQVL